MGRLELGGGHGLSEVHQKVVGEEAVKLMSLYLSSQQTGAETKKIEGSVA